MVFDVLEKEKWKLNFIDDLMRMGIESEQKNRTEQNVCTKTHETSLLYNKN